MKYFALCIRTLSTNINSILQIYKAKNKLEKHFGHRAQNYHNKLIYYHDDLLILGQAVETTFKGAASEFRFLQEAAMMLKRQLMDAKRNRQYCYGHL